MNANAKRSMEKASIKDDSGTYYALVTISRASSDAWIVSPMSWASCRLVYFGRLGRARFSTSRVMQGLFVELSHDVYLYDEVVPCVAEVRSRLLNMLKIVIRRHNSLHFEI